MKRFSIHTCRNLVVECDPTPTIQATSCSDENIREASVGLAVRTLTAIISNSAFQQICNAATTYGLANPEYLLSISKDPLCSIARDIVRNNAFKISGNEVLIEAFGRTYKGFIGATAYAIETLTSMQKADVQSRSIEAAANMYNLLLRLEDQRIVQLREIPGCISVVPDTEHLCYCLPHLFTPTSTTRRHLVLREIVNNITSNAAALGERLYDMILFAYEAHRSWAAGIIAEWLIIYYYLTVMYRNDIEKLRRIIDIILENRVEEANEYAEKKLAAGGLTPEQVKQLRRSLERLRKGRYTVIEAGRDEAGNIVIRIAKYLEREGARSPEFIEGFVRAIASCVASSCYLEGWILRDIGSEASVHTTDLEALSKVDQAFRRVRVFINILSKMKPFNAICVLQSTPII